MNPYKHSELSVTTRGGVISDYIEIHKLMDSTKELCSDNRHRVLHTHWGITRVIEPIIGETIINSSGKVINVKDICEKDHILPDYRNRFIPTLSDFVNAIDETPIRDWISKIESIHSQYKGNKMIERLLLSPLMITGKLKSLLLTHNSWFLHSIVSQIHNTELNIKSIEISSSDIFNNMRMELWMDNGTALPDSAIKINNTKIY